ncbi:uncharacterized protein [Nicotiana sylvestris]|uniref:uncharacterized protein n=1 Tax=Nicotiana sylvestris TaxID=4096 RepID=UPI00388C8ED7
MSAYPGTGSPAVLEDSADDRVLDLADWSHKLAACSTYNERKWQDMSKGRWEAKHHGIGEFSEMRPCPLGEEEGSSALGSRTDSKWKESSKDEGAHSEASPARRPKEDVSTEPVAFDKLKYELLHYEGKLRKDLDGEKSLRLLCDNRGKELSHLWYEANRSLNYESHLEKQLKSKTEDLECLWGEVGQAKHEFNDLRAQIDAHTAAKKNALAKVSALEVQLRNARENSSVHTSRIVRLESNLLEMKAKVVDARVEAEEIRAKADKKVDVYLKDVDDVRASCEVLLIERAE